MIESNIGIEELLERHLAPVPAPRELWTRVQAPVATASRPVFRKLAWSVAALLMFAGVVSSFRTQIKNNDSAALQALARPAGDLEFRSEKAAEIRAWIRTNAGIDVPLPENPQVHLIGASRTAGAVEIEYLIGDQRADLVISEAPLTKTKHGQLTRESLASLQTYSWTRDGVQYTLACSAPGELQAACSLCHVDSQWQTALN
jgi:hypothetical protein